MYTLLLVVTIFAGGMNGGADIAFHEVSGEFTRADCEAAAKAAAAAYRFEHWSAGPTSRAGSVEARGLCIRRAPE